MLAIDLGTDLLPALALGLERPSPRTLDAPPEPPRSPLLTRVFALRTFLLYGVVESALGMAAFFAVFWTHGWRPFDSLEPLAAARLEGRDVDLTRHRRRADRLPLRGARG